MKLKSIFLLLLLPQLGCSQNTNKNFTETSKSSNSLKVIELFTSEGCSSCPPADKLVEEIQRKNLENVIILAYHVDYWDRLGWKDTFSDAKYSDRQRMYAGYFKLNSIYTPQIVVNGEKQFVGSDRSALLVALKNPSSISLNPDFQIWISDISLDSVTVKYELADAGSNTKINFALVQNNAVTDVKRGENSNRKLSHVDIVRDFKSINSEKSGVIKLSVENLQPEKFHIVAFLQNIKTGQIITAKIIAVKK